ncbi:aminoacyl-tRNA hydrolase [Paracoccaceae bacterium]|nr:aminoacyl-tRNA hydrolase [Paracoccaceae bacterium]
MQIFVGLGNPGSKYVKNRHNIGFMALDGLASAHGFAPWKQKFQAQISEGLLGREKILLVKPQTFMNLSGQAVGEAARFYKATAQDVTVFHDELDLAPGRLKVKQGGGHAGHNGLRSMHAHIGEAYRRVRMGIGHPGHKDLVARYVLHDFAKVDETWLEDLLHGLCDGAADLAAGDAGRFMNAVALRTSPPRPSTGKRAPADKQSKQKPTGQEHPNAKDIQKQSQTNTDHKDRILNDPSQADTGSAETGQKYRSALERLMDKFK